MGPIYYAKGNFLAELGREHREITQYNGIPIVLPPGYPFGADKNFFLSFGRGLFCVSSLAQQDQPSRTDCALQGFGRQGYFGARIRVSTRWLDDYPAACTQLLPAH